jgi:hypothetical protein
MEDLRITVPLDSRLFINDRGDIAGTMQSLSPPTHVPFVLTHFRQTLVKVDLGSADGFLLSQNSFSQELVEAKATDGTSTYFSFDPERDKAVPVLSPPGLQPVGLGDFGEVLNTSGKPSVTIQITGSGGNETAQTTYTLNLPVLPVAFNRSGTIACDIDVGNGGGHAGMVKPECDPGQWKDPTGNDLRKYNEIRDRLNKKIGGAIDAALGPYGNHAVTLLELGTASDKKRYGALLGLRFLLLSTSSDFTVCDRGSSLQDFALSIREQGSDFSAPPDTLRDWTDDAEAMLKLLQP